MVKNRAAAPGRAAHDFEEFCRKRPGFEGSVAGMAGWR